MNFVAMLCRAFGPRRDRLLQFRQERQAVLDAGARPDFPSATANIRNSDWRVAPIPTDLQDRRVEITGPVDRKMIINALNSGANVFMADFEDSLAPSWANVLQGQQNLFDAVRRQIGFSGTNGKDYRLHEETATLMVRPRGWHLEESHCSLQGRAIPAALFDFGLFFYHNARELVGRGSGPYFYLPKLENHFEARLWADIFAFAEDYMALERGTIKCTVLIEHILAAFEMDEILFELRDYITGLNCGRWDYIFSFIKTFRRHPHVLLPDRGSVTMERPFLDAYARLLIHTCHRRGAHAMGGMAAQIPIKHDPAAHAAAMDKVVADKQREATAGHDGTWVAHPALVPVARAVFDRHMPGPHQKDRADDTHAVTAADLLALPAGDITMEGVTTNVRVGLHYLAAWLMGHGCVPINHLMEDAATAEISRTQLWQWSDQRVKLTDGSTVTSSFVQQLMAEEAEGLAQRKPAIPRRQCQQAATLLAQMTGANTCHEFLTLEAYPHLVSMIV